MNPYDETYVFHDGLNCPLPPHYIERHSDGRQMQLMRPDGTRVVKFAQEFPASHGIPLGTVAVTEVLRTALAFKIGEASARRMKSAMVRNNLHYKFVHPISDPTNPFHTSAKTIEDMQLIEGFQHILPGIQKKGYDDTMLKSLIQEAVGQVEKYSARARANILFVLITSDGDFSHEVGRIQQLGIDFVLIHNPDGHAKEAFLSLVDWHTGAWLRIVDEAQRARVAQNSSPPPPIAQAAQATYDWSREQRKVQQQQQQHPQQHWAAATPAPAATVRLTLLRESKAQIVDAVVIFRGTTRLGIFFEANQTGDRLVVSSFKEMLGDVVNPSVEAGIRIGDQIVEINGQQPASVDEALQMVGHARGGVRLRLLRTPMVNTVFEAVIHFTAATGLAMSLEQTRDRFLGVKAFDHLPEGVDNPSVQAGVRLGDKVLKINGKEPGSIGEAVHWLRHAEDSVKAPAAAASAAAALGRAPAPRAPPPSAAPGSFPAAQAKPAAMAPAVGGFGGLADLASKGDRVRLANANIFHYYKLFGKEHYFDPAVALIHPQLVTRYDVEEAPEGATGHGGKTKKNYFVYPAVAGHGSLPKDIPAPAVAAIRGVVEKIQQDSESVHGRRPMAVHDAIAASAVNCRVMPIIPGLKNDPVPRVPPTELEVFFVFHQADQPAYARHILPRIAG